jgi:hypothetical protein
VPQGCLIFSGFGHGGTSIAAGQCQLFSRNQFRNEFPATDEVAEKAIKADSPWAEAHEE